ncbi:MAG: sigma-54-dependent Fis family transcriptional regulator [Burkholderiales bacterium]|nr:sigma-54-dependent Fis family transcriptional regulator [Burkholderiales bacterium]
MSTSAPILVSDDDVAVRATLRMFLRSEGWECDTVASPGEVLDALRRSEYALLITDLNYTRDTTSGREGMDLIAEVRAQSPDLPIVAITAWSTVGIAVEAMRSGANDFIEKPWDNTRLANIVRNLLRLRQSCEKSARLAAENSILKADANDREWVCGSPAMRSVMDRVESVARTDVNILITGENGTGKSQLAELIHRKSSRASASLIAVNMGAIPDTLFESEMFGHQKGAFTDAREARIGRFELADGGTLFLDEIGNIPLTQQAKLLQAIETGQFERLGSSRRQYSSVRLITATNASLADMVADGRFRRDLLYRLNSVEITLPPLRERQADIATLAEFELQRFSKRYHKPVRSLSAPALTVLHEYGWPGNIRELSHCMERATLLAKGGMIDVDDLGLPQRSAPSPTRGDPLDLDSLSLDDAEQLLIRTALRRSQGNATQAAQLLGLSRSAFYRRLQKYGL